MIGRAYYLATGLPMLGGPGERPPLELVDLLAHVGRSRVERLVEVVLMAEDLRLRESFLRGEVEDPEALVMTPEQVRSEAPLPQELRAPEVEPEGVPRLPVDALWERYAWWVEGVGLHRRSRFLRRWIRWEVGLRNALATARARALDLDPEPYLVAAELSSDEPAVGELVREWEAAMDVASSFKVLIRGRWTWLALHRPWFTFEDDEFPAYAAELALQHRWWRVARPGGQARAA